MRQAMRLIGVVAILALFAGCAATTEGQLYQSGAVSKHVAESSYQAIYAAYQTGHVSEEDMTKARQAYDTWVVAQAHYVKAAQDGSLTAEPVQAVQASLSILMAITAKYALL